MGGLHIRGQSVQFSKTLSQTTTKPKLIHPKDIVQVLFVRTGLPLHTPRGQEEPA